MLFVNLSKLKENLFWIITEQMKTATLQQKIVNILKSVLLFAFIMSNIVLFNRDTLFRKYIEVTIMYVHSWRWRYWRGLRARTPAPSAALSSYWKTSCGLSSHPLTIGTFLYRTKVVTSKRHILKIVHTQGSITSDTDFTVAFLTTTHSATNRLVACLTFTSWPSSLRLLHR